MIGGNTNQTYNEIMIGTKQQCDEIQVKSMTKCRKKNNQPRSEGASFEKRLHSPSSVIPAASAAEATALGAPFHRRT